MGYVAHSLLFLNCYAGAANYRPKPRRDSRRGRKRRGKGECAGPRRDERGGRRECYTVIACALSGESRRTGGRWMAMVNNLAVRFRLREGRFRNYASSKWAGAGTHWLRSHPHSHHARSHSRSPAVSGSRRVSLSPPPPPRPRSSSEERCKDEHQHEHEHEHERTPTLPMAGSATPGGGPPPPPAGPPTQKVSDVITSFRPQRVRQGPRAHVTRVFTMLPALQVGRAGHRHYLARL